MYYQMKDNNTLINFSLHVNPLIGVNHLINLLSPTESFLVAIPETNAFVFTSSSSCFAWLGFMLHASPLSVTLHSSLRIASCFEKEIETTGFEPLTLSAVGGE